MSPWIILKERLSIYLWCVIQTINPWRPTEEHSHMETDTRIHLHVFLSVQECPDSAHGLGVARLSQCHDNVDSLNWKARFPARKGVGGRKHHDDVIMSAIASQITSLTIVYSAIYSGADQRKHQSPASLAFVRGIHRDRTKGQQRGKCFHLMTSSWLANSHVPRTPNTSVSGWNGHVWVWNRLQMQLFWGNSSVCTALCDCHEGGCFNHKEYHTNTDEE